MWAESLLADYAGSQADGGECLALCPEDFSTLPEESPGLVKGLP